MVTIVPKPLQKIPLWQPLLFYFSVGLLIAAVLAYVALIYFEGRSSYALYTLEEEIAEMGDEENKRIEAEVFAVKSKIDDFSILLAEHQKSSNFFKFLERMTHPQLQFVNLELNPALFQAKLQGTAPNFVVLEQQRYILQDQDSIKEIKLSDFALGEEGEIIFSLELFFSPEIFKSDIFEQEEEIIFEEEI